MEDKTYVPGMNDIPSSLEMNENSFTAYGENFTTANNMGYSQVNSANAEGKQKSNETPVVGFLYSISRKGIGEYWPLYLGQNHIGRAETNEIQLKEGTVSDQHACLSIKKMHSTGRLIASIRDIGSKTGMYLNDEELDYDNHVCKNGDLLTIGTNYQLLVILIEAAEYGLKISDNFIPVDSNDDESSRSILSESNTAQPVQRPVERVKRPAPTMERNFNPYSGANRRYVENGTIDLNGSGNAELGGGTEIL